ncbi:MAG: hypothetical protein HXX81_02700 [Campylobacterales bacterium]|nr:hypothetical protein [Campylobacterales bacterium]
MKKISITISIISSMFIIGCGGSGTTSIELSSQTGIGYLVDSPISGFDYICGKKTGTTDTNGKFEFEVGQNCIFYAGYINFIAPSSLFQNKNSRYITPYDIYDDNTTVINLARTMQTLDSDSNPANGITITTDIKSKTIPILFNDNSQFTIQLNQLATNLSKTAVTETIAQAHLNQTMASLPQIPNVSSSSSSLSITILAPNIQNLVNSGASASNIALLTGVNSINGLNMFTDLSVAKLEKIVTLLINAGYKNALISAINSYQLKSKRAMTQAQCESIAGNPPPLPSDFSYPYYCECLSTFSSLFPSNATCQDNINSSTASSSSISSTTTSSSSSQASSSSYSSISSSISIANVLNLTTFIALAKTVTTNQQIINIIDQISIFNGSISELSSSFDTIIESYKNTL